VRATLDLNAESIQQNLALLNALETHVERMETDMSTLDKFKANVDDTNAVLLLKADATLVEECMAQKADRVNFEHCARELEAQSKVLQQVLESIVTVTEQCHKITLHEVSETIAPLADRLKELEHSLGKKSNIKDVCKLLDLKANLKYVDSFFKQIAVELKSKAEFSQLNCCKLVWAKGNTNHFNSILWDAEDTQTNSLN